MRIRHITLPLLAAALTGCMSDKEAWLRGRQMDNQASHQQTYAPLTVQGPAKIDLQAGSRLEVQAPTQPYQPVPVPDGQAMQAGVIRTAAGVAAGTFLGYRALRDSGETTTKIIKEGAAK